MLTTPSLQKCFTAEVVKDEGVFLLSEFGHFVLTGRLHESVLPLIDGRRTAEQIAGELAGRLRPEEVYYALLALERQGFIVETNGSDAAPACGLWDYLGQDPTGCRERLKSTRVAALTTSDLEQGPLVEALAANGLRVGEEGDLTVVLASDYLRPELREVNREALRRDKPWLLAKPLGTMVLLGPVFRPGVTGCWECLAQRIRGNREVEAFLQEKGRPVSPRADPHVFSATAPAVVRLAAFHAGRAVAYGVNPQLEGKVISLDLSTLVTTTHHLVRRPQCPACGDREAVLRHPAPLRLSPQPKVFTADGGHRGATPEETFARYQIHISPITGIVKSLELTHRGDGEALNVYLAGHNFAMKNDSLFFLRNNLRSKSCGKGVTDAQARASALCEALERYSGVARGEEPKVTATFRELGSRAIHPNACMNFSEAQYRDRQVWLSRGSPFQVVPAPFDPDARIDWAPVWSFRTCDFKYLPLRYCYYGYPVSDEAAYCWADSNGSAAGNTLEEAILQGFLELVERDAVAVWWYNRLARPAVDLDGLGEPYIDRLRGHYRALGREFWVLDLTHDFLVPAFVAVSRRVDQPVEEIVMGFGAHLDARLGVLRALTEMNQFLPAVNGVGANGQREYGYTDPHAIQWWQTATVANQPYLLPLAAARSRGRGDWSARAGGDVLADVLHLVRTAEVLGLETLVLDQSRPDVGLRVAKVFVPGMRHFWARLGPGRLYDVPVRLGWLSRPLQEHELNPIPMFL